MTTYSIQFLDFLEDTTQDADMWLFLLGGEPYIPY
jgi:hypothetical protein